MQVNNISETQPQFKGMFVLHNPKLTTSVGEKVIDKIAISTENVKSIIPIAKISNEVYNTLIRTKDHEEYSVKAPFDAVLSAYKQTAFSNNVAELDAYTTEETSQYWG